MFNNFFENIVTWMPRLLEGAVMTIVTSIVIMAISCVLGLLYGIVRFQRIPVLMHVVVVYVEIFRGLPAIVVLFIFYFAFPAAGWTISDNPWIVGVVALSLTVAAYLSEVFRASLISVDKGQQDASTSVGLTRVQSYRYVIVPQALRIAVPTLGGYYIGLIKETSLLSFITVTELMRVANDINSATFLSFQIYILVGAMYIILGMIASRLVVALERRLDRDEKRPGRSGPRMPIELRPLGTPVTTIEER